MCFRHLAFFGFKPSHNQPEMTQFTDTAILKDYKNKNSSGDEIANVNFDAVRPEATRIRWNNAK